MTFVIHEAHKLFRKYGTSNPRLLADYLDIEVIKYPMAKLHGIYFSIETKKFAAINSNLSYSEQQYILLHEIAHARLHPEKNYFAINKNRLIVTGKYERQARIFAIILFLKLTPEEDRPYIQKHLVKELPESYLESLGVKS